MCCIAEELAFPADETGGGGSWEVNKDPVKSEWGGDTKCMSKHRLIQNLTHTLTFSYN